MGNPVVLEHGDRALSGTVGYVGETDVRIDGTGPFVGASSISLAPPQAAALAHSAASHLPTKSDDFAGTPQDNQVVNRAQFEDGIRHDERNAGLFPAENQQPAQNFRITDDDLGAGGPKTKFAANTYSETPQGSGCSPILSNIYLHELDRFMAEYKQNHDTSKKRPTSKEYEKFFANTTK